MLVFTSSRERTESEHQDLLHRAGLTLVKTTPHCLTTQHSRGHTCPRRTALAVSLSATDLDQLRWTAEAPTPVGLQALPLRLRLSVGRLGSLFGSHGEK